MGSRIKNTALLVCSYIVVFFSVSFLLAFYHKTYSQTDSKITVSPAVVDKRVRPGNKVTFSVKITNNRPDAKTYFVFPSTFSAGGDESGKPTFQDSAVGPTSMINWFEFPVKSVALAPGERKEVPVTISVPATVDAGGYYGAIIFSEQNPELKNKRFEVGVTEEVGTLVLLSIEGLVKEEGRALDVAPAATVFTSLPVTMNMRFENTGNVHLKPTGLVEVFNILGEKEATLQINPGFNSTLPKSIRKYEILWNPDKYFGLIPRMGIYRAEPVVLYGATGITQKMPSFTFYLLPKKFVGAFVGGFVIFCVVVYAFLRSYRASVIKTYSKKKK